MMRKMRGVIGFMILGVLLVGLHAHFSNTESFLNDFYQFQSKARDFDRDGDCEHNNVPDVEFIKLPQFNMVQTIPYVIPVILSFEFSIPPHFFLPTHIGLDYTLSIFRPPIAA